MAVWNLLHESTYLQTGPIPLGSHSARFRLAHFADRHHHYAVADSNRTANGHYWLVAINLEKPLSAPLSQTIAWSLSRHVRYAKTVYAATASMAAPRGGIDRPWSTEESLVIIATCFDLDIKTHFWNQPRCDTHGVALKVWPRTERKPLRDWSGFELTPWAIYLQRYTKLHKMCWHIIPSIPPTSSILNVISIGSTKIKTPTIETPTQS